MSEPPRFDWYKIPGLETPTPALNADRGNNTDGNDSGTAGKINIRITPLDHRGTDASDVKMSAYGDNEARRSTMLNAMFNHLKISLNDKAYHSDETVALKTPELVLTGRSSSSSALDESGRAENGAAGGIGSPKMDIDQKSAAGSGAGTSTDNIEDDDSIPLSLTADELTKEEAKTYLRWYDYIESHKRRQTGMSVKVTLDDVFLFLHHFGISDAVKRKLMAMFARWAMSLSIGQFFALLRLISHALRGDPILRISIKRVSPIPKPLPIMARGKRQEGDDETTSGEESDRSSVSSAEDGADGATGAKKLDLDSFTQFILTGEKPPDSSKGGLHRSRDKKKMRKKKKNGGANEGNSRKRVKFSDQVVCDDAPEYDRGQDLAAEQPNEATALSPLDFQLPMGALLKKLEQQRTGEALSQQQGQAHDNLPNKADGKDVPLPDNKFQNVQIDSVSVGGVPRSFANVIGPNLQPLAPNLTGSASKMMRQREESGANVWQQQQQSQQFQPQQQPQQQQQAQPQQQQTQPQQQQTQPQFQPQPQPQSQPSQSQQQQQTQSQFQPQQQPQQQPQPQPQPQSQPQIQQPSSFLSAGNQRANFFLESALTGGGSLSAPQNAPKSTASPLSPPPLPARRKNFSNSYPYVPPKPQLSSEQRQKYASTINSQSTAYSGQQLNQPAPQGNQGPIQYQQKLPQQVNPQYTQPYSQNAQQQYPLTFQQQQLQQQPQQSQYLQNGGYPNGQGFGQQRWA